MEGAPKSEKREKIKRSIIALWIGFFFVLLSISVLIYGINEGWGWFGYMPSMSELENPSSFLSSDVYAADGTILGRYYLLDRSNCKYNEISPNVINALVATEDARFFFHAGIDPIGTIAIPFYALIHKKRGSSTITQQLAKNLFPNNRTGRFFLPFVKLKEWVLAVKLERNLTKNEIITLYLNTVPFGSNVWGIRNASLTFYNKMPKDLSVDEAASLVGMLKGNTSYNPRIHPKQAKARRNQVLELMYKNDYIDKTTYTTLVAKETPLDFHKIDYHTGIAPYFRQVVEQQVKLICKDLKKADGTPYDIYKDGLKIYTTIDIKMQKYAEEAIQEHLSNWQKVFMGQSGYKDGTVWNKSKEVQNILNYAIKNSDRYLGYKEYLTDEQIQQKMRAPYKMKIFAWNAQHSMDTIMSPVDSIKYMKTLLQSGFMAMDPNTGEVKAWVGGIDHNYFQYDHVNLNTKRQVGSTIKPILYCLAVKMSYPTNGIETNPQVFPGMDHPYNAGGSEFGNVSMKKALALSINNAALFILRKVGIDSFVEFAHRCGIVSRMDRFPSVALGVSDISLYEMMNVYSMFPNAGINTQPFYITKIEDKNGMLLKSFSPVQKEIINPVTAYKMVDMMRGVVNYGTGSRLRYKYGIMNDVAGKTGTTQNQSDAWFIGYTPQLLAGVWVGCDNREFRFHREDLGQGASSALPIWGLFLRRVYADAELRKKYNPSAAFKIPEGYQDSEQSDEFMESPAGSGDHEVIEKTGAENEFQ
jgi:penicillin-binding protein 1A